MGYIGQMIFNAGVRLSFSRVMSLGFLASTLAVCAYAQTAPRVIQVDIHNASGPVDRFFDLSVGSDYPGTLIRDDSQAQQDGRG